MGIKSKFHEFKIGDRVETTRSYSIKMNQIPNEEDYHSGHITTIHEKPNIVGSLVSFVSEETGGIETINEKNLQLYKGERYKNGELLTSTTIEDILNGN